MVVPALSLGNTFRGVSVFGFGGPGAADEHAEVVTGGVVGAGPAGKTLAHSIVLDILDGEGCVAITFRGTFKSLGLGLLLVLPVDALGADLGKGARGV